MFILILVIFYNIFPYFISYRIKLFIMLCAVFSISCNTLYRVNVYSIVCNVKFNTVGSKNITYPLENGNLPIFCYFHCTFHPLLLFIHSFFLLLPRCHIHLSKQQYYNIQLSFYPDEHIKVKVMTNFNLPSMHLLTCKYQETSYQ